MFKSIQWKMVAMFVLLVLAIMVVFGTVLQDRITIFYHDNFKQEMQLAFSDELNLILNEACNDDNAVPKLKQIMDTYSGRIGINSNRNYYILDYKSGKYVAGSQTNAKIDITDNIISAMAGKTGDNTSITLPYIDYAKPFIKPDKTGYIIYVIDTKSELLNLTRSILGIIAQSLVIGIFLSFILGFIMSRTLTRPIINLTKKAESIAQGKFNVRIDVKSNDELGKLAKTFDYMANMIKNSLDEISQEKNKLEMVLQHMTDGVIAFDSNQNMILINSEAELMLGVSEKDNIKFDSYFNDLAMNVTMAEMVYMEHTSVVVRDFDVGNKHLKAYLATFKSDNDKLGSGVVVVIQDLTEMQKLEKSRREFVANVSHELRTPLTTIKTYAETLNDSAEKDYEKSFLNTIVHEVDRMTRLVKDLLTLSKLDYNKLTIVKQQFNLDELVKDVVTKMTISINNMGKSISLSVVNSVPPVFADIDRIEQVVTNIISNSAKYTGDDGKIEVFVGYLYNEAYIKIKDNGVGIPEKDLPRIFERFYRVDKARSRENGGTGLGLSIAYEIIKLHGGNILIDSEFGKGTEVIIKLPVIKDMD